MREQVLVRVINCVFYVVLGYTFLIHPLVLCYREVVRVRAIRKEYSRYNWPLKVDSITAGYRYKDGRISYDEFKEVLSKYETLRC